MRHKTDTPNIRTHQIKHWPENSIKHSRTTNKKHNKPKKNRFWNRTKSIIETAHRKLTAAQIGKKRRKKKTSNK